MVTADHRNSHIKITHAYYLQLVRFFFHESSPAIFDIKVDILSKSDEIKLAVFVRFLLVDFLNFLISFNKRPLFKRLSLVKGLC